MGKFQAAVIFGGQSSEHIVFCMSAVSAIEHINRTRYDVLLVGVTENEHWIKANSPGDVKNDTWRDGTVSALLLSDATKKCILLMGKNSVREVGMDVVFPIFHGLYGEDDTIQRLSEPARISYAGYGVLSSAVSIDKLYIKITMKDLGAYQAAHEAVYRGQPVHMESMVGRMGKYFPYLVLVKSPNADSSRGVTKADDRQVPEAGLLEVVRHDRKILVEGTITGREIECAVFGGGLKEVVASSVGEILAAAEFYDFEAKHCDEESRIVTDLGLPAGVAERVYRSAVDILRIVDGYGPARVNLSVKDDGRMVFNEISTTPGFTAISMYPMLWEARGITKDQLVDILMVHRMERYT